MTVITKPTIEVLKNFCSINKSIVIKPGNQISTLSINKNILAIADVEEQFVPTLDRTESEYIWTPRLPRDYIVQTTLVADLKFEGMI